MVRVVKGFTSIDLMKFGERLLKRLEIGVGWMKERDIGLSSMGRKNEG